MYTGEFLMQNQLPRLGPRVPLPSIVGKKRAVTGVLDMVWEFTHSQAIGVFNDTFTVPEFDPERTVLKHMGGTNIGTVATDANDGFARTRLEGNDTIRVDRNGTVFALTTALQLIQFAEKPKQLIQVDALLSGVATLVIPVPTLDLDKSEIILGGYAPVTATPRAATATIAFQDDSNVIITRGDAGSSIDLYFTVVEHV